MEWNDLLAAFALYLVLEGLLPFFNPKVFKDAMANLTSMPDSTLRYIGLGSMIAGAVLLAIVR